jgi:hypothetical protein
MSLHTKPTVFFSHSSKDKEAIKHLKDRFLKITGKTIDVFVSSDGQSIPLGHNWVKTIEDALGRAKLMFVFVTPNSIGSPWLPFEAAFSYSRNVAVVPVVFGGLSMENLPMPLSLLQGFSVDNHEQLNNIIARCNDSFGFEHELSFLDSDMPVVPGRDVEKGVGIKQVAKGLTIYPMCEQEPSDEFKKEVAAELSKGLEVGGRKCLPWPLYYPGFSWNGEVIEVDAHAFVEDPSIEWCLREIMKKTGGFMRISVNFGNGYVADPDKLSASWKLRGWMTEICEREFICKAGDLYLLVIDRSGGSVVFDIKAEGFSVKLIDQAIKDFVDCRVITLNPGGQLEEYLKRW